MRRVAILLALGACAGAPAAHAQSAGAQTCTIFATPLVFGAYRPMGGSPNDFTAILTVDCTATSANAVVVYGTIALTGGSGPRRLISGGDSLSYQLFTDSSRSIPWGDGGGGTTVTVSGFASHSTPFHQTVTVYGRLLAHQTAARVGDYADVVTAILSY